MVPLHNLHKIKHMMPPLSKIATLMMMMMMVIIIIIIIIIIMGDDREGRFLFQRLSMALQRYNAILLHESFEGVDDPDL